MTAVVAPETDVTPAAAEPSLWRNRSFNLLWSSQLLSDLGTNMSQLAFPLLVLALTGSAITAGVVGTSAAVIRLALRLPSGVIADRVNRKRTMILCDAVRLVAFVALGLLVLTGHAMLPLILAAAVVEAVASTIFGTIQMAALRNVVPLTQVPAAVARDEARSASASLVGPPLGGVLFSVSRGLPFLGDALSYLFSMIGVSMIRTPMQEERTEPAGSVGSDLREGIRFALSNPFVRTIMMSAPLVNLGFNGLFFAIVLVLRGEGVAPGLIGTVETIVSIGGLAGAFAAGPLQRLIPLRRMVLVITWLGALLIASAALLTGSIAVAVPIAVAIFFAPASNAAMFGYQAALTPDRLQGRVVSVLMFAAMSLSALAPLVAGGLYDWLGGPGTVLVFAGVVVLSALIVTFSKSVRNMRDISEILAERALVAGNRTGSDSD
jgi:MFS family permease